MRMKSPRGPKLVLAVVNIAILVGATLAIQSQASDGFKPTSWLSFSSEPEFALPPTITSGGSSAALPSPKSSRSDNYFPASSASSARAEAALREERDSKDEHLWYSESPWPFASSDPGVDDVSSWPTHGDNFSLSAPLAAAGGSSASRGRHAGGIGGGSGATAPGGGGIGPQSSAAGSAPSENSAAGLRSSADGPTAATAGNPFFEATGTPGGASFPLAQFPGNGPANANGLPFGLPTDFPEAAASALSANVTAGRGVTTLQQPVSVPEPSSLLLLGGALAVAAYRRRKKTE